MKNYLKGEIKPWQYIAGLLLVLVVVLAAMTWVNAQPKSPASLGANPNIANTATTPQAVAQSYANQAALQANLAAPSVCAGYAPLNGAQVITDNAYDTLKPGLGILTSTQTAFLDPVGAGKSMSLSSTVRGTNLTILSNRSGYFSSMTVIYPNGTSAPKYQTPCDSVAATISQNLVKYDSATLATITKSDGSTPNNATSGYRITIGSGSSGVGHVKLQQNASYTSITGEIGQFAVFINATNQTDWNPSMNSISFAGVQCSQPYVGSVPSAISTGVVLGTSTICNGGYQASDSNLYDLAVKLQAANGVTPANQTVTVTIIPLDYYTNSITGAPAIGAVKDTGAAIQTGQSFNLAIGSAT